MNVYMIEEFRMLVRHALDGWSDRFELVNLHEDEPTIAVMVPEGDTEEACDIVAGLLRKIPDFQVSATAYGKTLVFTGSTLPPGAIGIIGHYHGGGVVHG